MRVLKYTLTPDDPFILEIPAASRIISVKEQRGDIVLYVLSSEQQPFKDRYEVYVYGTGHMIPQDVGLMCTFLGTVTLPRELVFHVFYRYDGRAKEE